jgi:2-polyprenyl-3-methyl-5-hydroxy-6-metoxy-1,4-benzoquinol methylase
MHQLYGFSVPSVDGGNAWPLTVLQCDSCKLVFLAQSEALALAQGHFDRYWEERWGPVYNEHQESVHAMTIDRCEWLEGVVGKTGRLLDMGCGDGSFLATAKLRGWEVSGIEVTEVAARRAQAKVGEERIFQTLEAAQYPNSYFDVVTLWDVIEHLPDPVGALRQLVRLLCPGGQVVISTPNASSLLHRLAHYAYRCTLNCWTLPVRMIYLPEHLYYFAPKTLTDALNRAGLGRVEFESDLEAPKGLFDNLDALFSANRDEGWTRLPFLKPAIATILSFSRWLRRPYRLLVVAHKESDGS